jgi:hypothetical protein
MRKYAQTGANTRKPSNGSGGHQHTCANMRKQRKQRKHAQTCINTRKQRKHAQTAQTCTHMHKHAQTCPNMREQRRHEQTTQTCANSANMRKHVQTNAKAGSNLRLQAQTFKWTQEGSEITLGCTHS